MTVVSLLLYQLMLRPALTSSVVCVVHPATSSHSLPVSCSVLQTCLSQGLSLQLAQQDKFCSKTSQCPVHSSSAIPHVVPFFPFSRNTRFWFSLVLIPHCLGLSSQFVCSWGREGVRQQASQKLLNKGPLIRRW